MWFYVVYHPLHDTHTIMKSSRYLDALDMYRCPFKALESMKYSMPRPHPQVYTDLILQAQYLKHRWVDNA